MNAGRTKKYILRGLHCANCAAKIEAEIHRETGLSDVGLNFSTQSVFLPPETVPTVQRIIDRIEPGVQLVAASDTDPHEAGTETGEHGVGARPGHAHGMAHGEVVFGGLRLAEIILAALLFVLGLVFREMLRQTPFSWGEYGVFLTAYVLVGKGVIAASVRNMRRGNVFDENFLMTVATLGAIAIRELPEAVGVMLFYSIGEAFQDYAVDRSRRSIKALLEIRPEYANVQRDGGIERMSPEHVPIGETIVIRPGEKVPLDGTVLSGSSFLDTSALTGESVPRRVQPGDTVLAGTINTQGLLTVKVTKPFGESSVAKILALVENAGARKARTEKFITRFSRFYTPAVVFGALALAVLPPLLLPGATFSEWIYRALVLLVISCPCALVLSIPLGYFGGIGGAARRGILVKGANYLDVLTRLDTVVLDKTGTLTRGVFKVTDITTLNGCSKSELLDLAAHAESFSQHPIAASIRDAHSGVIDPSRVEQYEEIAGQGIKARIDGRLVVVGNDRLLHQENIPHTECVTTGTVANVAVDGTLIGRITISDEVKPDAASAIQALRKHGVHRIVMLTGDTKAVADQVAADLDIDEVYAELLPEGKVAVLERIAAERKHRAGAIAFAGDGINDAPVLMRADVGIAMGGLGSDAAIEAADVVVMDDMPTKIGEAVAIARRTRRIVVQNIVFALAIKLIVIAMGSFGHAGMWEAVFADVGVSLLAILNSMRALRSPAAVTAGARPVASAA